MADKLSLKKGDEGGNDGSARAQDLRVKIRSPCVGWRFALFSGIRSKTDVYSLAVTLCTTQLRRSVEWECTCMKAYNILYATIVYSVCIQMVHINVLVGPYMTIIIQHFRHDKSSEMYYIIVGNSKVFSVFKM